VLRNVGLFYQGKRLRGSSGDLGCYRLVYGLGYLVPANYVDEPTISDRKKQASYSVSYSKSVSQTNWTPAHKVPRAGAAERATKKQLEGRRT